MISGLFFVSNFLIFLAYLVRDMLWLRVFLILSSLTAFPYLYFLDDPYLQAMGWKASFLAIHSINLSLLLLARRPILLDDTQRWLHQHSFRLLTPHQMLKVLKLAETRRYKAAEKLIARGDQQNQLLLLLDGNARVDVDEQTIAVLHAGEFVGEMGFITGETASADVISEAPLNCLIWKRQVLDRLYAREPEIKVAMQGVIGADMARKLAR